MSIPRPLFSHERLDVYCRAIEFLKLTTVLLEALPRGAGSTAEQLRRAATSIPLNIAEGVGRATAEDKRRHFTIARGSALECAALLDVLEIFALADEDALGRARVVLTRVVEMLSKMAR